MAMTEQEIAAANAGKAPRIKDRIKAQQKKEQGAKFSGFDLPTFLKEKDAAIAKIDRQASEAKAAIEREYKLVILKITNDLKRANAEIKRIEKLKGKQPSVTRTQAKSKVLSVTGKLDALKL